MRALRFLRVLDYNLGKLIYWRDANSGKEGNAQAKNMSRKVVGLHLGVGKRY